MSARPSTPRWAPATTIAGVAAFLLVVVLLHVLQPDYRPRSQLMSELALGRHGWAMLIAFAGLATAVFALRAAIAPLGSGKGYRALLTLAAMLFMAAGIFPLGATSLIHISAVTAAFVLSVLAMYLFPTSAGKASVAGPRRVSWPLALGVVASIGMGNLMLSMGIAQRLAAAFFLVWLTVVSWKLWRAPNGSR